MQASVWENVGPGIFCFRDSCNVYAVKGPKGTVLINAGTGLAADHLTELGISGDLTLLLTHHFRDHTDGAIRLAAAGAKVMGNYWDREYYLDPLQHFQQRRTWVNYENRWDRHCPVRPIPVSGWMMDYSTQMLAGLEWDVLPTPGLTEGASTYIVTINGMRYAFVGELLYGGGKISRLAPLQYGYHDFNGTIPLWRSTTALLEAQPVKAYPSMGTPIDNVPEEIAALRSNLQRLNEIYKEPIAYRDPGNDDLSEVLPHLFFSNESAANTFFVISKTGQALALDYTYRFSPGRPLLHGLRTLKKKWNIDRIHTVIPTHYHDDHICGIPLIQRVFGTELWAPENFADILEHPERYDRPCLWPEPLSVHRKLPLGETFYWNEIAISLHPMSGHTRFSALICFEVDGKRVAHTGDQFFFQRDGGTPQTATIGPNHKIFTNHVYKNGLDLGCYHQTLCELKRFDPDLIISGHHIPYHPSPHLYRALEREAQAFDDIHRALMPLGEQDAHFGAECQPAKLKPYRVRYDAPAGIQFDGWAINPFDRQAEARLALICPDGWTSTEIRLSMRARETKHFSIAVEPPANIRCKRQPLALDMTVEGRCFGHVTEALVTIGYDQF